LPVQETVKPIEHGAKQDQIYNGHEYISAQPVPSCHIVSSGAVDCLYETLSILP
jgi:hypothetical protein